MPCWGAPKLPDDRFSRVLRGTVRCCCRSRKDARARMRQPYVVELVYFQRVRAWTDRSRVRLDLPALDLPVSRTGMELHYSPRFRVEPQPGAFRVDHDPGPTADALRAPQTAISVSLGNAGNAGPKDGLQTLVDRFRNESGGRSIAGLLPVHVEFPNFGLSLFLASELTAETSAPVVELLIKRVAS